MTAHRHVVVPAATYLNLLLAYLELFSWRRHLTGLHLVSGPEENDASWEWGEGGGVLQFSLSQSLLINQMKF